MNTKAYAVKSTEATLFSKYDRKKLLRAERYEHDMHNSKQEDTSKNKANVRQRKVLPHVSWLYSELFEMSFVGIRHISARAFCVLTSGWMFCCGLAGHYSKFILYIVFVTRLFFPLTGTTAVVPIFSIEKWV